MGKDPTLKRGTSAMDAVSSKQFLISRVIDEALFEHVALSEVERKMLQYSEIHETSNLMREVNEEFEREYDSDEYEAKIINLLRNARDRDSSTGQGQMWHDAIKALKNEDHYILVMVHAAFREYQKTLRPTHRLRDFILCVAIAAALLAVIFTIALLKR